MSRPVRNEPQERARAANRFFLQLRRFRRLLRLYWWLPAGLVTLVVGAQLWLTCAAPPTYVSVGQMIVNMRLSANAAPLYTEELNNFLPTQVALLRGDLVANNARERLRSTRPNLRPCRIRLDVSLSPKTSIFNLRAEGTDPDYTQGWLDACMEEYVGLKKRMRRANSDNAINGVADELARLDDEIRRGREELISYAASNSLVYLPGNSAANYLENLTRRLADLKLEALLLKMLTLDQNVRRQQERAQQSVAQEPPQPQARLGQPLPDSPGFSSADPLRPGHPTLTGPEAEYLKADQQVQLLNAELKEWSLRLKPNHPRMIALKEEIQRTERLLGIYRLQSAEQLESREHELDITIQNVGAQIKEWETKAVEEGRVLAGYQSIKENNQRLQDMRNALLSTSRTIDVDKEISPETVSVLQAARAPLPAPPKLAEKLVFSAMGGLTLALGILLLWDRMDDRPTSLVEVQALFEEPVMGQIPLVRGRRKGPAPKPLQTDDHRHTFKEAFCNLRSALLYMNTGDRRPKLILITSAIPNDGKSTTAVNLAITLAEAGARVLLVDADLRRGSLHETLSVPAEPGLAAILAQQAAFAECLAETSTPNLWFLARGDAKQSPGRLFLAPEMGGLLREARDQFDYVLFDTAPIVAADDVSNLAPKMDGVLMVVRANHTPGRLARAALELLYLRQVPVLGLVFNAIEASFNEYYYYNYPNYDR